MKNNAIYDIKNKVIINYSKELIELPENKKKKIEEFWQAKVEKHPHFFRGDLVTASNVQRNEKGEIVIDCKRTDYAHFLYEKTNRSKENSCCSVWAGNLLETKDNKYILGRMTDKTSSPGRINLPGGSIDYLIDVSDGKIDPKVTARRELEEEIGIDSSNPEQVIESELRYIKVPCEEINSVGFLMKVKLNYTAEELKGYYKEFQKKRMEAGELIEFDEIFAIEKDKKKIEEFFAEHQGKRYDYLVELVEKDARSVKKDAITEIIEEEER